MGIGDELMVTAQARVLQLQDPRRVEVIDRIGRIRSHAVWLHNPRIIRPDEEGDFQLLRSCSGYRPYIRNKRDHQWEWKAWDKQWLVEGKGNPAGEIYLTESEKAFGVAHAGRIIIEPHLKSGASPNKNWGIARWQRLVTIMHTQGYQVTQLGPVGTQVLTHAKHVVTPDFRSAAAVVANARLAVLHEGGLHHAAAAFGIKAVVLFGGYISPVQTGYDIHDNVFVGEKPCGSRFPCKHCAKIMEKLTPEIIMERFLTLKEQA